jgi:hypothetical protein
MLQKNLMHPFINIDHEKDDTRSAFRKARATHQLEVKISSNSWSPILWIKESKTSGILPVLWLRETNLDDLVSCTYKKCTLKKSPQL